MTALERLLAKVEPEPMSGCWLWTGCLAPNGYGLFAYGKQMGAHRAAYLLLRGPITEETLDHVCRLRSCVNPDHLRPLSNRENILSGIGPTAINAKKTHCIREHELSGENLQPGMLRQGQRSCRKCFNASMRESMRRRRERNKACAG